MTRPLKVMIYDETTIKDGWDGLQEDGLAYSWKWGSDLYVKINTLDLVIHASSWVEGLSQLLTISDGQEIGEIQFWGHGSPGTAWIGRDKLNVYDLLDGRDRRQEDDLLLQVREQLTDDALIWFRTCSTFCGHAGQLFATELAEMMQCRVAGHTFKIGPWQAGLHSIGPDELPSWSPEEGIKKGTPTDIKEIGWSIPFISPRGVSVLRTTLPKGW